MRAHYTYIFDTEFDKKIQNLKEKHEKYMALLLENIDFCKELEDLYSIERHIVNNESSSKVNID